MSRLAIIHTTAVTVQPLKALAAEVIPGIDVFNIVDDSILPQLAENGGDIDAIEPRWVKYVIIAEKIGADVILNACSSVGELTARARTHVRVPVVRIDEPMAEEAVRRAARLGIAATLPTTLHPTVRLLKEKAADRDARISLTPVVVDEAFRRLSAGDAAGHDAVLAKALTELVGQVDLVVLAQASMARVVAQLPEGIRERFLASPPLGMQRVRAVLGF